MALTVDRAVLLAAGRGQRLAPHTDHLPKPLLHLGGRPLLEYALCSLRAAGIGKVLLVIGYLGNQIRAHFGDGRSLDLHIEYIEQKDGVGTGAAALLAEGFVGDRPFFLGWGDIIAACDEYRDLFAAFVAEQPDALMLLERVDDPRHGAAIDLEEGQVKSLIEKPEPGQTQARWNQAGLAVYQTSIFSCLRQLRPSERGELEFTAAVQMLVDQGLRVRGIALRTPRLHLTRPEDIARVEATLTGDDRNRYSIAEMARDD